MLKFGKMVKTDCVILGHYIEVNSQLSCEKYFLKLVIQVQILNYNV